MIEHYITWWNVENLFDIKTSSRRPKWLAKTLAKELKYWNSTLLEKKLNNLASVMIQMNQKKGSDIYGLCEIENLFVLEKLSKILNILLPHRNYNVIHHNTDDKRGIDIGVIHDSNKYKIKQLDGENKIFTYRITKRSPTRDILQVEFETKKGNDLVLLLNHWTSRMAGKFESEPYRIISAETLSYWVMRIQEILGDKVPIIVMGDFNDEPFDRSLTEYALSTNNLEKVKAGRNPYLYNLMWELAGNRLGTYVYGSNSSILDQILVSKGLLFSNSNIQIGSETAKIEVFKGMLKGKYKVPVRFKVSDKKYNTNGFSDHLPISIKLTEK
ncbi:endonuclease/exonuclease/phosphatase family protein [Tenacibaculum aestuariivivum]|uniref:endonuclease/exonuclease/phosphatase family protein n=1 Tax=Tenacibaculum aestuariivivum TaxID=2006131 RepID=UPI003AB2981E